MMDSKVFDIWTATASACFLTYDVSNSPSSLAEFQQVSVDDVLASIASSSSKQCDSDPMQTWILKKCSSILAPYITNIFNISLSSEKFPKVWKDEIILPHLKKVGLDETVPSNYRPVANLPFLSKVLERIANHQLKAYLEIHNLLPGYQSAYMKMHSTEMAVLKVFSDLVDAIEKGEFHC